MIEWVIGIIIFAAVLGVLFRITKGVVKTAITALMLLFLIFSVLVVFAFIDAKEFSAKFSASENAFIFMDNGPKAIFTIKNSNVTTPNEDAALKYFKSYDEGKLNSFYKLFLIKKGAFPDASAIETENDVEKRNRLFADIFKTESEKDNFFILKGYKKGNIDVVPRTALFRFVSFIPYSWIEKVIKVAPNE